MKKFFRKYILYLIFILFGNLFILALFTGKINPFVSKFFESIEDKTFDIRQEITSVHREPNKDIIIVGINDNSYDYITENYGEWPMPRYIYADIVDYIEAQNPKTVAFDLLFQKSLKSTNNDDERVANLFKKYDNLYTAIAFDNMPDELRTPLNLDEKFFSNVNNKADIDIIVEPNVTPLLPAIMANTGNVGHVTIINSEDGILRDAIPFIHYTHQDKYFPHMSLLVGQKAINSASNDFIIDKDNYLKFDNNKFPVTKRGTIFLNWFRKKPDAETSSTVIYPEIGLAEVINAAKLQKEGMPTKLDGVFKDKIVYIGTTSIKMGDIKTVPIEKYLAGVEYHANFVNNVLDNNFIKRLNLEWDFGITLILSLLLAIIMLKVEYSKINYKYMVPINTVVLILTIVFYYIFSVKIMQHYNIWVALIMPTVGIISTFILTYVMRYFFKSQDYEYTYRLATTDGLTELYNHRFFQEKMLECVENCKKSGKKFSLILTDIDFFKKFNDTYGHQAGDTVLRQVARILKKHVKRTDFVCRYGGEEMSVILINANNETATKIAERLCEAVSSNICKLSEDLEVNVTISLGVSTYPDNGNTPSELIEYSDRGLYSAKENGRNQVGVVKD